MRRLAILAALAALALAAALTACGHKNAVTPAPPSPPKVVTVQPPARSAGYAYDGQIWALFDRALDPASVDTTTVFLKQDTKRIPSAIGYEPSSRRIVIAPRQALALSTTYTVVITSFVRGKDGTPLGADYFWQFSTSSVRRPKYLYPDPGQLATPVAMLSWSSDGATPGVLVYDVYASTDSLAVSARTAPRPYHGPNTYWLPRVEWPAGQRVYWALTTTNQSTSERIDSPVTGFTVMSPGAPTHVVTGLATEWGGLRTGFVAQYCSQNNVVVGTGYTNAVRFDLDPGRMGKRVKSARVVMYATSSFNLIPGIIAWACSPTWTACGFSASGPPYTDVSGGALAAAYVGATSNEVVLSSTGLAAWAEGMLRGGNFSGLIFTLSYNSTVTLSMSGLTYPRPIIELVVYD